MRKIGNKLGKIIRVDHTTSLVSRGKFARVCMEVDITQPLISRFTLEEKVWPVAYEGMHLVCFSCGLYGHRQDCCPTAPQKDPEEAAHEGTEQGQAERSQQSARAPPTMGVGGFTARPYGPWMIAQRKERRQNGKQMGQGRQVAQGGLPRQLGSNDGGLSAGGSRFSPLENDNDTADRAEEEHRPAAATGSDEHSGTPIPSQAEHRGRPRRANVIVSEKQIANDNSSGGITQPAAKETITNSKPSSSRVRRAAEEDEHVVIRGEQGGKVVSSTRVSAERTPKEIPVDSMTLIPEHHGDPPSQHDDEGDVVMEIEEHHAVSLAEAGPGGPPVGVTEAGQEPWFYTVVYGSPSNHLRRRLWVELSLSKLGFVGPWMVAGFSGPSLTWIRGNSSGTVKGARLDRVLCNVEWRQRFPNVSVVHLPRISSDHAPILIRRADVVPIRVRFSFKFQAAWLTDKGFSGVIESRRRTGSLQDNIASLTATLDRWNRDVFGNILRRKRSLLARLKGVQRRLASGFNAGLLKLEKKLTEKYHEVLYQEELLWSQRSREEWIVSGDRNTAYYHAATLIRNSRNSIVSLRDGTGEGIMEGNNLKDHVRNFYVHLFTTEGNAYPYHLLDGSYPRLMPEEWREFNKEVSMVEVHNALTSMAPFKAPGPDGFHAAFYQRMWGVVGNTLYNLVKDAYNTGALPVGVNDNLLVLIPKVNSPETIKQFRPISLCNVTCKLVTKTITNRLKAVLPKLVRPFQSSFVPGKQISDNILVYQEIMHTMRTKKGKTGYMAIKLDLEKAYDRLSWDFIEMVLRDTSFSDQWTRLIMHCIRTPCMSIIWNGERLQSFRPQRGIRQGDAMCPAIFVRCMDKLSQMISHKVSFGDWKGVRMDSNGPIISHLCFADDMVLFTEATVDQVEHIRLCLEQFCAASGQKISYDKSQVFFSRNTDPRAAEDIATRLEVMKTDNLGRYLGVPSIHGRVTCQSFNVLLDRVTGRLEGWKTKMLSMVGRVTLAKAVLNAIPTYTMQTTVLPKGVCMEIEKKTRQFIWGNQGQDTTRKINLVSWDTVTKEKVAGGLGIRRLQDMNRACMAKLGWHLIHEKESLWAQTLLTKYKTGSDRLAECHITGNTSHAWKGILEAFPIIDDGMVRLVRNGRSTRFWLDKWISRKPLSQFITAPLSLPELYANVAEYWEEGRGWMWERVQDILPMDIMKRMASIMLVDEDCESDSCAWALEDDGRFSVRSAYAVISDSDQEVNLSNWKRIWELKVPNKICFFIWLLLHGKILTNAERRRRHLTTNDWCVCCAGVEETCDHLFRYCSESRGIWDTAACSSRVHSKLQNLDWTRWLLTNLEGDQRSGFGVNWPARFAIRFWWIWKWGNDTVFNGRSITFDQKIQWIRRQEEEVLNAFAVTRSTGGLEQRVVETLIAWKMPESDWMKMNVDGSVSTADGSSSCGGVLRDTTGTWRGGFMYNIGSCSIGEAEGWGVFQGLSLAARMGVHNLIVECDSLTTIEQLQGKRPCLGVSKNILRRCIEMRRAFTMVEFCHVYREQNRVADALACQALTKQSTLLEIVDAPLDLRDILHEDQCGASFLMKIPVSRAGDIAYYIITDTTQPDCLSCPLRMKLHTNYKWPDMLGIARRN
ncbi:uncharacterized protein LOC116026974 [Ipomoea triloba]|uniref:uncharacterized protein LOC116026974 n=1 Tax=Ipomoea triloba TaxID=35885 RepID=UPI00125E89AF|nr:uncharacterized protein LOC116026974 [Ipomoea triloba]